MVATYVGVATVRCRVHGCQRTAHGGGKAGHVRKPSGCWRPGVGGGTLVAVAGPRVMPMALPSTVALKYAVTGIAAPPFNGGATPRRNAEPCGELRVSWKSGEEGMPSEQKNARC